MSERTGIILFWIIIILINIFLLAGGHGGRGSDYQEYQYDLYE